jgi:uncharacterized protein (DUF427 family)
MEPNPAGIIRIVPHPARLRVLWDGKVIADTTDALVLYESSYPGVRYIPRSDVDMTQLSLSPRKTRCPRKGEAFYFSLISGAKTQENVVWSYETPLPDATEIAGYLAFDPKYVEFVENTGPG